MEKIFSHLYAMSIVTHTVLKGNLFLSLLFVGALMDLDLMDTEDLMENRFWPSEVWRGRRSNGG